jgi:DNA processing protein
MQMTKNNLYVHACNALEGFGTQTLTKIAAQYDHDFEKAWHDNSKDMQELLSHAQKKSWYDREKNLTLETLQQLFIDTEITIITQADTTYPASLKNIDAAPYILYTRGNLKLLQDAIGVAIVGTRKYTSYGAHITKTFVPELVQHGLTIVSGLALGIDTIAHEETVAHKGKTIAVLGGGIDTRSIYPGRNQQLAKRILETGGLLISEYPPHTEPLPHNFPQRNRIIAGLASATVVIEAPKKSGARITAFKALDAGKDVFAVPGPITAPQSTGCNLLIKQGAYPALTPQDIIDVIKPEHKKQVSNARNTIPATSLEQHILETLTNQEKHLNEITRSLNETVDQISSNLTIMEIKGMVKHMGNGMYTRIVS